MKSYFFIFCFGFVGVVGLCLAFTPYVGLKMSVPLTICSLAGLILSYCTYGRRCAVEKIYDSYQSLNNQDCVLRLLLELNKDDLQDLIKCLSEKEILQELAHLNNQLVYLANKNNFLSGSNRAEREKINLIIEMLNKQKIKKS